MMGRSGSSMAPASAPSMGLGSPMQMPMQMGRMGTGRPAYQSSSSAISSSRAPADPFDAINVLKK